MSRNLGPSTGDLVERVADSVMRTVPWNTFCDSVNNEITKHLKEDNVEVCFPRCCVCPVRCDTFTALLRLRACVWATTLLL